MLAQTVSVKGMSDPGNRGVSFQGADHSALPVEIQQVGQWLGVMLT